ncbi:hypothetical protein, partial [uncultured Campylobacter sp.]|uniref:hypothetical protein n=1 Tax=uncultured Campylobacter sp. TaxID=218934 RepID=UPI0026047197
MLRNSTRNSIHKNFTGTIKFRRKIAAKFRGGIFARNFELQNSAQNFKPRNPREILPAKFTGKIL